MIHFVPIGVPHDDDMVVCEIRNDGEPGFGYIVASPKLIGALEASLDVVHAMDRARHPDLHPEEH